MSTPETTPRVGSRRAWRIAIALTLVVILAVAATGLARSWWVAAVRSTYVAYFANTNGLYTGDDIRIRASPSARSRRSNRNRMPPR